MKVAGVSGFVAVTAATVASAASEVKSGIGPWVDPATPKDKQTYVSSRGANWQLVMSDEFNEPKRSFEPGEDHLWTSVEKPDGVNGAFGFYSHNMSTTACDDDGTCSLQIEVKDELITFQAYNEYSDTGGLQTFSLFYRSAMLQSWNKFCFQGGMIESRVQLPGVTTKASGNPDITGGGKASTRVSAVDYYPTWPGIWMMGNLGRAIFSGSTKRMWPFSYDECNAKVLDPSNQRISACDQNPGHGLNPGQGRGAPEIDLLEGGGTFISSSLQIGPGMPSAFRPTPDSGSSGKKLWYQKLKYAANNLCSASSSDEQTIKDVVKSANSSSPCSGDSCSASKDPNADLSPIDGNEDAYWGVNTNGTCFAARNSYMGGFLCNAGNTAKGCPPTDVKNPPDNAATFAYQYDAVSANWNLHLGAYTDYVIYQIEWVTGDKGYIRWQLDGQPLYEIPAGALTNPLEDSAKSNPKKIMVEEPLYLIFNIAMSSNWSAKPPNPGQECRGDGKDAKANKICDAFPLYMKIDYIRLYQDDSMSIGCDPKSHPTAQFINDNIEDYTDPDNQWVPVAGKAFCSSDDDCSASSDSTGTCVSKRCKCDSSWTGPRCTVSRGSKKGKGSTAEGSSENDLKKEFTAPSLFRTSAYVIIGIVVLVIGVSAAVLHRDRMKQSAQRWKPRMLRKRPETQIELAPAAKRAPLGAKGSSVGSSKEIVLETDGTLQGSTSTANQTALARNASNDEVML